MTLRVRLSVAFTAILLGPALVAALFTYRAAVGAGPDDAMDARALHARTALRTAIAAECAQLDATARALAVRAAIQRLAFVVSPPGATGVWAVCGASPAALPVGTHFTDLAARAPVGSGWAYAVRPVDAAFLRRLSAAAGAQVSLGGTGSAPVDAAQPLPLLVRDPVTHAASAGVPVAAAAGATALLLAVALGWWLGGLATRPLHTLLSAVDRIAAGDLSAPAGLAGPDEAGQLGARLDLLASDIRETQRLAVTDALTGLGNVRQLTESLRLEVERAARFGRTLGVLLLDLDHFKQVNDSYGHRAGDAVLTELARRVRGVVREVDLVFRQGGEEFVVLLPETGIAGSLTAARRIGDAVRDEPFGVTQRRPDGDTCVNIPVTVSIGVAVFPRHGATAADAVEAADTALYAAKAAGRDTFVLAECAVPAPRHPCGITVAPAPSPSGASARASSTRSAPDR